ncbi:MAG: response regulator transcription factor [Cyanobacteria bacterium P01_A01_bin.3]
MQDSTTISVLIVDDQSFVQEMLKTYLSSDPTIQVVGSASSGQAAISQIEALRPDIAIMDIEMPGLDGLSTCKAIAKRFPDTKVLVLSTHDDIEYLNRALMVGVKGYLHKATPPAELINAVHSIHKGYFQLGPGMQEQVLQANFIQEQADMMPADSADERVQQLNALANQSPPEPHTVTEPLLHPAAKEAMLEADVRRLSPQERLRLEHQLGRAVTRINDLERTTLVICLTLVVLATLGFIYLLFFY